MPRRTTRQRFDQRTIQGDGCWQWTGTSWAGYGRMWDDRTKAMVNVHRIAYELFIGPIPPGHEIDHLCRNPGCCNPEHLEAVNHQTNIKRGKQGSKIACIYGHDWSNPYNAGTAKNGRRYCRECRRIHNRESYLRKKEST
jgi:hypothetical protein